MVLFAEIFQIGVGLTKQYGFFFKFWLGPELKYTVQDPKDIEVSGYKSLQNKENYKNTCFLFRNPKIILSSMRYIDKAFEYSFLRPWLNDGLLVSTGDNHFSLFFNRFRHFIRFSHMFIKCFRFINEIGKKWHDRRKIITPAFHFKMLEKFTETFDRISNTFIEKIQELDSDKAIELFHMVELFALDVVCGK